MMWFDYKKKKALRGFPLTPRQGHEYQGLSCPLEVTSFHNKEYHSHDTAGATGFGVIQKPPDPRTER